MSKRHRYFDRVVMLFWLLFAVLAIILFLDFGDRAFNKKQLLETLKRSDSIKQILADTARWKAIKDSMQRINESDTLKRWSPSDTTRNEDDFVTKNWTWSISNGRRYTLSFKIRRSDYTASVNRRVNSNLAGFELWSYMYQSDKNALSDMVRAYRDLIVREKLDYFSSMEVVVASIQSIPYTWVLVGDRYCGDRNPDQAGEIFPAKYCRPRTSPSGCCDNVVPWGVFSPIEFVYSETGDCDTKSLMAYFLLEELSYLLSGMGYQYDVSMMMGKVDGGYHAMLGVNLPNPPYRALYAYDQYRVKYYAWEITTQDNLPGQPVWSGFKDWNAMKLK
jgi:hypothetical protein